MPPPLKETLVVYMYSCMLGDTPTTHIYIVHPCTVEPPNKGHKGTAIDLSVIGSVCQRRLYCISITYLYSITPYPVC